VPPGSDKVVKLQATFGAEENRIENAVLGMLQLQMVEKLFLPIFSSPWPTPPFASA
jgi:hypothetical protein